MDEALVDAAKQGEDGAAMAVPSALHNSGETWNEWPPPTTKLSSSAAAAECTSDAAKAMAADCAPPSVLRAFPVVRTTTKVSTARKVYRQAGVALVRSVR